MMSYHDDDDVVILGNKIMDPHLHIDAREDHVNI